MDLKSTIRSIPDFPKPGILFRDISTLLKDGAAFSCVIDRLAQRYPADSLDAIAGIESRGFIFGAALAAKQGMGFIPIRKPGKLPAKTVSAQYSLEYGTDTIEMHVDAVSPGMRVLLIDDLLATGGTMRAACELVEKTGGIVAECCFIIELADLKGREALAGKTIFSLLTY
ncbi:MAG: adenine phosphoribosyltransferase [Deltaproteobacteria bacterium]|nr:adenine phosphoribosyltransferase [Deltaproteobacteria bacterium]